MQYQYVFSVCSLLHFHMQNQETQKDSFINKSLNLSTYCCSVDELPLLNWTQLNDTCNSLFGPLLKNFRMVENGCFGKW